MDKQNVKELAIELGADLVGIATINRFINSPAGHSPRDKFPACRSVIVLGCTFAQETLSMDTSSYTAVRNGMVKKLDLLAQELAGELKKHKFKSKAIGSLGGKYENGRFYGNISLKHAAELAGLGVIGRNYLLCNEKYGNLIWLSSVLTDMEMEPDPLVESYFCGNCALCVDACPASALDSKGNINQKSCYKKCYVVSKGVLDLKCWKCRDVCPRKFGYK